MLQELRVENLLLIERAELRPAAGLNVLTGETGAGKTVLAHALDLLLGGRARAGIVRPGARESYVEGFFEVSDELAGAVPQRLRGDSHEITLSRRVGADGRTRAYVNGRAAPVGELHRIGSRLLTFYGQHEHRRLTLAAAQLEIVDGLCGAAQRERLERYRGALGRCQQLRARLLELRELAAARERELDLIEYELGEIETLEPDEDQLVQLRSTRERMRRAHELCSAAAHAAQALDGDPHEGAARTEPLASAASRLGALAGVDASLDELGERLHALVIDSRELAAELRDYGETLSSSALEGAGAESGALTLEQLEERIELIERLVRKHGGSVASVLEHAARARERREQLLGAEQAIEQAGSSLARAEAELRESIGALRRARHACARRLRRAVREQLASLAMEQAGFEVVMGEREPGPDGADAVEFTIAPNPGVPAAPLRDIASGGELSRVMLAIMCVADAASSPRTLVFDEIDAGIGGHTARAVGARLRELAQRRQVLCITHLPQIASLGERHFAIVKDTGDESTHTTVLELDEREVVSELVRMLGADRDDSAAQRHARELLRAA